MAKAKFKFNPDTLNYDKIDHNFKDGLLRFLAYFVGSVLLAGCYYILLSLIFDSPKEKLLKREIEQLTTQYALIQEEMNNIETDLNNLQQTDDILYRTIFEADPLPSTYRSSGVGGIKRYKELEGMSNSDLVIETTKRLDNITRKIYMQSKSFDDLTVLANSKEDMIRSVPAIMPISNKDLKRTASGYGMRMHPIYKIMKFHKGMDFTAPSGTNIYATGNGMVSDVVFSNRGLGNHIILDHGYGYKTVYAHMSKFNVRKGTKVKRGDVIGFVGSTGLSVAPHLHYEVLFQGENVNPVNYYFNDLSSDEYEKMIRIASNTGKSFD